METLRPIGRQGEDPAEPVLLRPFLITAVGASAFWTCIYAAVGARVPVVILLLGTAGFGLCLLAHRRLSTPLVSHLALAVAFALIFGLIAVTGGITGITTPWLPVLTIFSVFLLAPAGTAGWGAILVLLTGALLLAEGVGFTFPTTIPENTVLPLFGLSVITAVTTSVVLVWFFARVQLRARRVVVEASRNLRKVLDAIPEPLIVLEPRGDGELRYAYGNEPMARLVGQDPTGLKLDEAGVTLRQITRDFLGEVTASDRRHVARKLVRVRGEERLLQVISQPLVESGEIRQVVAIVQDLTKESRDQQLLMRSARLASIGELVAGVAHELRNPLMVIKGVADTMDASDREGLEEDVRAIRESAGRASRIVDGLLKFSRQTEPERRVIDLNEVIRSVLDLRQRLLVHAGIEVRLRLEADPVMATGDHAQLEQVVLNLLNNAEKALLDGDADDRWIEMRTESKGRHVRLSVEDNGPGIPPDLVERIFDPFFTTRPVGDGTGLGLALVYGIVEEHGGTVSARSPPGHGAIFSITLPRASEAGAPSSPLRSPDEPPSATGCVLVVDDEPHIRRVIARFLRHRGYRVREAENGQVALEMANAEDFDAVILDWRMPEVGGAEVYDRWREEKPDLAERVIIATGDVTVGREGGGPAAAGRPVLEKPFDLVDLAKQVAAVIPQGS